MYYSLVWYILTIYIYGSARKSDKLRKEKKSKEDEQNSVELSSAHRRLKAKCRQVQTSYIKRIKFLLLATIINILLTELSRSVWENLDLGRVCRLHYVRSLLTTSVEILPYRPPAWLVRIKNSGHLRTLKKCRKHSLATRVFYISLVL